MPAATRGRAFQVVARQVRERSVIGAQAYLAHQHRWRIGAIYVDTTDAEAIDVAAIETRLGGKGRAIAGAARGSDHALVQVTVRIRKVIDLTAQQALHGRARLDELMRHPGGIAAR